ncbi:MAG: RsmG family class I SAM-dependent methyltransferase [Alkalispirochaeta sp.]
MDRSFPTLSESQLELLARIVPPVFRKATASDAALSRGLARYITEVFAGNPRFGLIARDDAVDPNRFFSRHILDSIAPWRFVLGDPDRTGGSRSARDIGDDSGDGGRLIYDLGSGAGLPGIPLALVAAALAAPGGNLPPEFVLPEIVLVERRTKRVNFLRGAVPAVIAAFRGEAPAGAASGAKNTTPGIPTPRIRVLEADADRLSAIETMPPGRTVVVFRAYQQTTPELLRGIAESVPGGTPVYAWKGRREQTDAEAAIVSASPWVEGDVAVDAIELPGSDAERTLLRWSTRRVG